MKITPRTEEEIRSLVLLKDGEYNFSIIDAVDKISQNGNEMIHLILEILNNNNKYLVHDYLLDSDRMSFKIRHCCESVGIVDKYNSGEITSKDFIGKSGKAKIIVSIDKKGVYDTKNIVKDYIICKKENNDNFINDDVPF